MTANLASPRSSPSTVGGYSRLMGENEAGTAVMQPGARRTPLVQLLARRGSAGPCER